MNDFNVRKRQFYNPAFSSGFWSEEWLRQDTQAIYTDCLDRAWNNLLNDDGWYEWLMQHADTLPTENDVWFQDDVAFSIRKKRGRKGIEMTVPSKVFAGEIGGTDLMRTVIVALYAEVAELAGITRPPTLNLELDVLRGDGTS